MKIEINLQKELDDINAAVNDKLTGIEGVLKNEDREKIRTEIVDLIFSKPNWIAALVLQEGKFKGFFVSKVDRLLLRAMRDLKIEREPDVLKDWIPDDSSFLGDDTSEMFAADDDSSEGDYHDRDTSTISAPFTTSSKPYVGVPPKPPLGDLRNRAISRFKGDLSLDRKYLTYTDRRDWYNDVFYHELSGRGRDGEVSKYLLAHLPKPPPGKENETRIRDLVTPDQFVELYRQAIEYANAKESA